MRKPLYLVGDFETTVYKGQDRTEVWASAVVPLFTENVQIHHSIDETFNYLAGIHQNVVIYYHNLKFDGSFWLDYLLAQRKLKQAYLRIGKEENNVEWLPKAKMKNNTFKYSISAMGQWYTITIKVNNHFIEIRDSLKLLPFSVKRIGKAFKTKHQKLDMEYTGFRYAGCEITEDEKKYIANDVLVVKEALEIMFQQGHDKLTIGACCLQEFKDGYNQSLEMNFESCSYDEKLPNLYAEDMQLAYGSKVDGIETVGDYIRASYRGGWCYLVKGKEEKEFYNGTTADVNSLYPSMMSSESGNYYPVGRPWFWKGNFCDEPFMRVPKIMDGQYWFVRLRTRFYIKPGMLPTIQLKHNCLYKPNEFLTTSDVLNPEDGNYYSQYIDLDGEIQEAIVEMTMTQTDYQLMIEHYNLKDTEILDGAVFKAEKGLFDSYMAKYKKIKQESKGAMRELAKLFLNNLYGKMASSTDSSFKLAYVKDDGVVGFMPVIEAKKKPGYIPIGSAITSYARNFTIRAAQKNYHGLDKPGFIYADTDSIHCDLPPDKVEGIKVHPTDFCCWKLESCWDVATFTRQKTYIEHVVKEDLEECEPYYNVKCAGMPQRCKDLFVMSLTGERKGELTEEEEKFLSVRRTLDDFHKGLLVPSKLMPKRIKGGILLKDTTYEMR